VSLWRGNSIEEPPRERRRSFSRARGSDAGDQRPCRPWSSPPPRRRGPQRTGAQCESAAAAHGVETPASLVVAVNELRVLAHRAEDSTRVVGAAKHDLLIRGRLHGPLNVRHREEQYIGRTSSPCLGWTASDLHAEPDVVHDRDGRPACMRHMRSMVVVVVEPSLESLGASSASTTVLTSG
jgi:hypothetical protein